MAKKVDYLIVGGGITGRLVQLELMQRGLSTLVYDASNSNQSTIVAAGLANPLVGKFFTIGWRAEDFFTPLSSFYADLEKRLSTHFFRPKALKRIIASAGEQNIWLSKAHQQKYKNFCRFNHEEIEGLSCKYGVLTILQGGELDTRLFLQACNHQLPTTSETFDFTKLDTDSQTYDEIAYENIVFCEGYLATQNPYWKGLIHVIPTKGEILEIETALKPKDEIYLGPIFLQHIEGSRWRVGSTYQANDVTLVPTEEMKVDIQTKLEKLLKIPYTLVDHYVGIRPASEDRKPLIDKHPTIANMYICNGMGSKAVSMAPVLTTELVDSMESNTPMDKEVLLDRF